MGGGGKYLQVQHMVQHLFNYSIFEKAAMAEVVEEATVVAEEAMEEVRYKLFTIIC